MSGISLGCTGRQPRRSRVSALDVGLSIETNGTRKLKCWRASSAAMLTTGSFNWRPMASAMSRNGTPSSATACSRVPAGADSTASRNRVAASSRCTDGHRFDPSPTKADTPVARAMPIRVEMNPRASPSPCTVGANRIEDERTPRSPIAITDFSTGSRRAVIVLGSSGVSSVSKRPGVRPKTPEVTAKGLLVPSNSKPIASTAFSSTCARSRVGGFGDVLVRGVYHAVRCSGSGTQAVEVLDVTTVHFGTGGRQCCGGRF
jgi:hypothetical protein